MSELIDRQAAIDALRYAQHRFTVADEAGGFGTVKWSEDVIYFAAAERVLSELPSVQPEIVRCKECKYWDTSWQNDYAPNYHYCPNVDGTRRDDFYCADAERRTDE